MEEEEEEEDDQRTTITTLSLPQTLSYPPYVCIFICVRVCHNAIKTNPLLEATHQPFRHTVGQTREI